MRRLVDFYIRRAGLIGAVYCAVPSLGWFLATVASVPFREVYLLRLGLCLTFGCAIAAFLNRYGLELWLAKHRSKAGPATVCDGALIGAAIGVGSALLPTLSALIKTNHPEMAKTFIIVTYLLATLVGSVFGTVIAAVGRRHVERGAGNERQIAQAGPDR